MAEEIMEEVEEVEENEIVVPEWKNASLNPDGSIDCEINHETFGWIPFTASMSDSEALGPVLHQSIRQAIDDLPENIVPIEDAAKGKLEEIEAALNDALNAGMPYTMPDGTQDVVQTRPEDENNLLGLAIEARDLRDAGVTADQMTLRTKSNRLYALTPLEMIAITDEAKAFKKRLLAKSWELKDAVSLAVVNGDRDALEALNWETEL